MLKDTAIFEYGLAEAARNISLEERIKRIIHSPVLELDGNAYIGKYELGKWKSIRAFIDKLRLNSEGKNIVYENADTGDKIIMSGEAAGKITQHWKDGEVYQKTLAHIPTIIEKMKLLDETAKGKIKYSYFITPIKLDGIPKTILSTVRRAGNDVYYDHNVFDGIVADVFNKAKYETAYPKYSRLNKILNDVLQKTEGSHGSDLVRARGDVEPSIR